MFAYALGRWGGGDVAALRVITLAGLLPDADVLPMLFGIHAAHSLHGTITHSLLVLPILALALSGIVYAVWRRNVVKWAVAGFFLHFVLDIPNLLSYSADLVFNPIRPISGINLNPGLGPATGYIPWFIVWGILLGLSIYLFARHILAGEPAWRIWVDERRLFKVKASQKR